MGVVELESGKWLMWLWPTGVVEEHGSELSLSKVRSTVFWVDNIHRVVWAVVNQSSRSMLV